MLLHPPLLFPLVKTGSQVGEEYGGWPAYWGCVTTDAHLWIVAKGNIKWGEGAVQQLNI